MQKRAFYDYKKFVLDHFGGPLERVPLDLGFGCPVRSTRTSSGGCLYCDIDGSRASHLTDDQVLTDQVRKRVERIHARNPAVQLMAYCQAYTSTYAPLEDLEAAVDEILAAASFRAITFGTRPDCLPLEVLDYLTALSRHIEVWVELGVQTAHDVTLEQIRRGHDFACSVTAIQALAERGLNPVAHVILGLPGEGKKHFRQTAAALARLPLSGLKLHNLHVITGTDLAECWRDGSVNAWDEHEYAEILIAFLRRIPQDWPILRLVSDTPRKRLLAPRWWMSKHDFAKYMQKQMNQRGWAQGDLVSSRSSVRPGQASTVAKAVCISSVKPQQSDASNALAEILADTLSETSGPIRLLDIGFGLGHTALALATGDQTQFKIHATCLAFSPADIRRYDPVEPKQDLLVKLLARRSCQFRNTHLELVIGDPRMILAQINVCWDVVIIEPRHVDQCPYVTTAEFWRMLNPNLADDAVIVTPMTARRLRAGLMISGLCVGTSRKKTLRGGGTVAAKNVARLPAPLPQREHELLNSGRGPLPYRDPELNWSRRQILRSRSTDPTSGPL